MFTGASWLDTAGMLLIVFFFLAAGFYNLQPLRVREHISRLAAVKVPFPAAALWIGLTMQFTGCALLVAGWHADIGVILLIIFTATANALFHRFWTIVDPARRNVTRLLLLNGIAIIGGLLLLLQNVSRGG